MANQQTLEGSTSCNALDESSESTVELNVKTLDSQIYSFHVDKNMTVSVFKEKIASQIGVPVGQQRLIFRGKVLKDDHLLSEYHVENGHTLHLVERQPSQSQPSSSDGTEGSNANNGQEPSAGGPRNRIGQISHSVVLGTLNVGDQGDGIVPDLSRVIGAVLNSVGIGNQIGGAQPGIQFNNTQGPTPHVSETEGTSGNTGNQSEAGNQPLHGQTFSGPSLPHVIQIPVGAAIAIPSVNAPIPNSLNTLLEFINRMEQTFAQNADRSNQSPSGGLSTDELPLNSRGVATPEGLSIVLRVAERLIGGSAVAALSHIAGRLEQEACSTDAAVRGQIQTESVQLGLAMQHLGALFLELGRTILTLHMGQSPAESFVNAGPAVYISPSGPNPIMVQPFPLQTSSLFGSSAPTSTNSGVFGPIGIGNIPRHVNIHIHTVGTRANTGEGSQGEHNNSTGSGDSGQIQVFPARNVIATAIPAQPAVISISAGLQPGAAVPQVPVSASLSNIMSEVNSQMRNIVDNMQNEQQASPDQSRVSSVQVYENTRVGEDQKVQPPRTQPGSSEGMGGLVNSKGLASTSLAVGSHSWVNAHKAGGEGSTQSWQDKDIPDGSLTTPVGLGLGGLQPKRRSRLSKSQSERGESASTSNQDQSRRIGQRVLESLASLPSSRSAGALSSAMPSHSARGIMEQMTAGGRSANDQIDVANAMSQMLHSPALDGLLTGVSRQTGIGSPDVLRNMMEQLTQNPAMRNTVNQMAQQIDSHDVGSMLSGLAGNQGGNVDLSRMIQQMMPIVSQALGGAGTLPQSTLGMGSELRQSRSRRDFVQGRSQVDLRQIAQRIEHQSPPREIFRAVVENTVRLYNNGGGSGNIVNEICREDVLANEFMKMLHEDISRRCGGSN